ncbi:MAG: cobyric acid synthase CobQ, partial [Pseudomonadota bacterium]
NVSVTFIEPGQVIPADTDLIILPGSKSTVGDLGALRAEGWDVDIKAHARRGGAVLGLCGGYQMLGRTIHDPAGIEGPAGVTMGLGLLDVDTVLTSDKTVRGVRPVEIETGATLDGYEIHLGQTRGADTERAWLSIDGRADGAIDASGRIQGTYVHGLFSDDAFRSRYLDRLRSGTASELLYEARVDAALDALAAHCETYIDLDRIAAIAGLG